MGIEERKEREKAERRKSILEAAMSVYLRNGYHGTTMSDIARQAELGRATLYLYFKTKDEIFVHAIVDLATYFGDLIEEHCARHDDSGVDLLHGLWECFERFYKSDPVTFDASLYFHQGEMIRSLPDALRNMLDHAGSRNYRLLCRIMEHGIERHGFRPADPKTLAEVVWTAFLGIVHLENSKKAMHRKNHLDITSALALDILAKGILKDGGEKG